MPADVRFLFHVKTQSRGPSRLPATQAWTAPVIAGPKGPSFSVGIECSILFVQIRKPALRVKRVLYGLHDVRAELSALPKRNVSSQRDGRQAQATENVI